MQLRAISLSRADARTTNSYVNKLQQLHKQLKDLHLGGR